MSDSVRPHRRQPTRLPCPWDSPGKNTGVGCHFLLQCMKVKLLSRVWLLATPWTAAYQAPPSMGFSKQEYWSGVPTASPKYWLSTIIISRHNLICSIISCLLILEQLYLHCTDSLPAEPQGKPKNTRVGSLSLLQGIFPTQESNQGLLQCRQILYQLSYSGKPKEAQWQGSLITV